MNKGCHFSIFILGYILISSDNIFSWKPLIWIGVPVFFIGLVFMGMDMWTGWRKKTLTGWRLWLKSILLILGILFLAISVIAEFEGI